MCWCDKVYSFVGHHSRLSVIPTVLITSAGPVETADGDQRTQCFVKL